MADEQHLKIVKQGADAWNQWANSNPGIHADLRGADLRNITLKHANLPMADFAGANLSGADFGPSQLSWSNFSGAILTGSDFSEAILGSANLQGANLVQARLHYANLLYANFEGADLSRADMSMARCLSANFTRCKLQGANLQEAYFNNANLQDVNLDGASLVAAYFNGANFTGASLKGANLLEANLTATNFSEADLSGANLESAILVETVFEDANLSGCNVYGISVWNVNLKGAVQSDLTITRKGEPTIMVGNLEVAQFIYLLLNNEKIRDIISTIGQKAVLILGRFSPPERKEVLEAIAAELRRRGFLPILFDFERSEERDFTETIKVLAGLSLFVIVDLTNPRSSPLELQATVPDYKVPFVPILQSGEQPFSMFNDLTMYDWVLKPVMTYDTKEGLVAGMDKAVINRALVKHAELVRRRAEMLNIQQIEAFGLNAGDATQAEQSG